MNPSNNFAAPNLGLTYTVSIPEAFDRMDKEAPDGLSITTWEFEKYMRILCGILYPGQMHDWHYFYIEQISFTLIESQLSMLTNYIPRETGKFALPNCLIALAMMVEYHRNTANNALQLFRVAIQRIYYKEYVHGNSLDEFLDKAKMIHALPVDQRMPAVIEYVNQCPHPLSLDKPSSIDELDRAIQGKSRRKKPCNPKYSPE